MYETLRSVRPCHGVEKQVNKKGTPRTFLYANNLRIFGVAEQANKSIKRSSIQVFFVRYYTCYTNRGCFLEAGESNIIPTSAEINACAVRL